jgi:ATP-dependent protease ClpP protease subunit
VKEAVISVRGVIGPGGFDWNTFEFLPDSYTDVYNQLQAQRPFTRLRVEIDSEGGYVSTGRAIRMLLSSQHVPIKTVAYSQCMSMATEIFAIGQEREMVKGCDFMIHKPYGGAIGNEDDIAAYLESLRNATAEMVDIYVAVTGKSEAEVRGWLVRDKSMTAEQAVENGFATKVIYEFPFDQASSAKAHSKHEPIMAFNQPKNMATNPLQALSDSLTSMKNDILGALAQLRPSKSKALALTTNDGKAVNVETAENNPAVGDALTIDGEQPADGDITLSDNQILTVAGGKITEIKAPESSSTTEEETVSAEAQAELVALRAQVSQLQAQLASERTAFEAQRTALEGQFTALNTQLEQVGRSVHSTYNPETRKFEGKNDDAQADRDAKSEEWKKRKVAENKSKK